MLRYTSNDFNVGVYQPKPPEDAERRRFLFNLGGLCDFLFFYKDTSKTQSEYLVVFIIVYYKLILFNF